MLLKRLHILGALSDKRRVYHYTTQACGLIDYFNYYTKVCAQLTNANFMQDAQHF